MNLFNNDKSPNPPCILPHKEGYQSSYDSKSKLYFIKVPDGELIYSENYFDKKISDRSMDYLLENENGLDWKETDWRNYAQEKLGEIQFSHIPWQHDQIKMFGKSVFIPRFSAWHGDADKSYTYSGLTLQPNPWNKGLNYLKEALNKIAGVSFNSVLLNWYRDGEDHMGWHADDEKELGQNPVIGSINLGATRRFVLRRNDNKKEKIEFSLKHGSVLIMKGALQHHWQHCVPKQKRVQADRINLTFRVIVG